MMDLSKLEKIKNDTKSLYELSLSLLKTVEKLSNKVVVLEEKLALSNFRTFGKKTEKTKDGKDYNLFTQDGYEHFNEAEATVVSVNPEIINENTGVVKKIKGKNFINEVKLDTEEKHYTVSDLVCSKCNGSFEEIGTKETFTLKVIPAKLIKVRNIQHTYKCSSCDETNIITAPKKNAFVKTMVEPSFVANIIYKKFFMSLPLYRQEKEYRQLGIDIKRKNLSNWFLQGTSLLKNLFSIMNKDILSNDILHADETTINVISKKNNRKSLSYMWLLRSSKHDDPISLYFYKESREHRHAQDILGNYNGYVHSDCYNAYLNIKSFKSVACLSHARRKLFEAAKASSSSETATICSLGMLLFNTLYRIEHKLEEEIKKLGLSKEDSFELIYNKRQTRSLRVLEKIKLACEGYSLLVLPKSKLGIAIFYFLNNYEYLTNYTKDGRLAIDNNIAERGAKSFAIGRKNFLFCFSEGGAEGSAIAYSIVETAAANNLKVENYLTYVFERMHDVNNMSEDDFRALLPYSKSLPKNLYRNLDS